MDDLFVKSLRVYRVVERLVHHIEAAAERQQPK